MTTQRPERRARTVAWLGLLYSLVLLIGLLLIQVATESQSIYALTQLSFPAVVIWFILLLVYHQRVRVQDETFEMEELKAERTGESAIFDTEDEQLRLARRRLKWMYKWLLPVVSIFLIVLLIVMYWRGWAWHFWESIEADEWVDTKNLPVVGWGVGIGAFMTFLMSRYVTGMSRYAEWRMLKAGSSYLMGLTLAMVAVTITVLAGSYYEILAPEQWVTRVLRVVMLLLAAEFLLNLILDFYRPKGPDEEPRPAFDSRFFGLFAEPGGIARSIAEAVNYQFGFEISSTWFYKLLERSVLALLGFAVLTLLLASCFVFVEADEVAVIQHFGRKTQIAESGVTVKLPWPIGQARKVRLNRVHELKLGTAEVTLDEGRGREEFYLWTNEHAGEPHMNVLVATPELEEYITREGVSDATGLPPEIVDEVVPPEILDEVLPRQRGGSAFGETGKAVAVSMLRVAVSIQYKIGEDKEDAYRWLTAYQDPERMIETIAMEEVTRYCAGIDVDSLMGTSRHEVERILHARIEEALDGAGLEFVDIKFLALLGVHPPVETAKAFQEVIGAEQKRAASIRAAEADYNKRLTEVAGTKERAERLGDAIQAYNRISGDAEDEMKAGALARVNRLFFGEVETGVSPVGGEAAKRVLEARAERWRLENQAYARAVRFEQERVAKDAAPEVYATNIYLEALVESVQSIRKYVIGEIGEDGRGPIIHWNLQDPMGVPIDLDIQTE